MESDSRLYLEAIRHLRAIRRAQRVYAKHDELAREDAQRSYAEREEVRIMSLYVDPLLRTGNFKDAHLRELAIMRTREELNR